MPVPENMMRESWPGRVSAPWRLGQILCLISALPLCVLAPRLARAAEAATPAATAIYSCTDERGRKLTSDRPIAECAAKEQRVLNRDGSLREVKPPTMTAEERAEFDARERRAAEVSMAAAESVRRDRTLLLRYRDEAAHRQARVAALDTVKLAMKASEQRLAQLDVERKPLRDEVEFYKGKPMPAKLKAALDANDAALDAQRSSMANQEAEMVRVNRLYDIELDRLKKLWAGARPGSLGPLPSTRGGGSSVVPAVATTR